MVRYKSTFKYTNPNNASCKVLSSAQITSGTLDIVMRYSSRLYQPLQFRSLTETIIITFELRNNSLDIILSRVELSKSSQA